MLHDRAPGQRGKYFWRTRLLTQQHAHNAQQLQVNTHLDASQDVGLIFKSLNLFSTCCVGPATAEDSLSTNFMQQDHSVSRHERLHQDLCRARGRTAAHLSSVV